MPRPTGRREHVVWTVVSTILLTASLVTVHQTGALRAGVAEAAVTWSDPVIVDQPVGDVPSGSGAALLATASQWHLVYCREGRVMHRTHGGSGWSAATAVSTVPGTARDPHLAANRDGLFVVWEDNRAGTPGVWARFLGPTGWDEETSLSPDGIPARAPSISAADHHAFAVWQQEAAQTLIMGRFYNNLQWQVPRLVSWLAESAWQPSSTVDDHDEYHVLWTERHGGRDRIFHTVAWPDGSIDLGTPLGDLPGQCSRGAIRAEQCCGDAIGYDFYATFEHTAPGGVPEIWAAQIGSSPALVSDDDGIASQSPSLGSFKFFIRDDGYGHAGDYPNLVVAWTELRGGRQHWIAEGIGAPTRNFPRDLVVDGALGNVQVAAWQGRPQAPLMAIWTEQHGATATLMSRVGRVDGCLIPSPSAPSVLLLAPEGFPADTLSVIDDCSGAPVSNRAMRIQFSPELEAALTWDAQQVHPVIQMNTNAQGKAIFGIRGGGCAKQGTATGYDAYWGFQTWTGARSPDIDGDCVVNETDLAAVTGAIGTSSFCADLDGSGLVDGSDLAIVEATLGDHCSQITAVSEGSMHAGGNGATLQVTPNPTPGATVVRLRGFARAARVQIVGVGGRVLREMRADVHDPRSGDLAWDGTDDSGRPVPSGVYLVRASLGGVSIRRTVVVLR